MQQAYCNLVRVGIQQPHQSLLVCTFFIYKLFPGKYFNVSRETLFRKVVFYLNISIYKELYKLVLKSYKLNEIPVGALVLHNNKVIGKGYNNRQTSYNVCGHAEINSIMSAEKKIKDWRLNDCVLICTLKPCDMCGEIIKTSRIDKVYYIIEQDDVNNYNNYIKLNDENEYINKIHYLFKESFKKLR